MKEDIGAYARETHRTKSNAIAHLAAVGMSAGEDHIGRGGCESNIAEPISISTRFGDVVDDVYDLADEEFDGTFSRALRWAIRNGLAEEEADD
jgi:hypothetical protein